MILLQLDLSVDAASEAEMMRYFDTVFRPAAMKFPGFVDLKMLKLRAALMGDAPPGITHRFSLTYESEELRQQWVTSAVHADVWGTLEKNFSATDYDVLLFDII